MLNDNRKINYRNGFTFSCLYYRFSKCVGYAHIGRSKHGAVACFASLLIKLKHLTSVHTSRSGVLSCVRWPGRRLACPVGLLGVIADRLQDKTACPLRPLPSSGGIISVEDAVHAVTCTSLHPCSLVFSYN